MIVLAIDTAGTGCAACLYDSQSAAVLGVAGEIIGRGHAERLMAFIDDALMRAKLTLDAVDRIAVTVGPGSFTGIRVGVAAARGLALSLSRPAVGVSTLEVLARSHLAAHPGKPVMVVMDAKRDEVYCQRFDANGMVLDGPVLARVEAAKAFAAAHDGAVCGSGAHLATAEAAASPPDAFDIAMVARIGAMAEMPVEKPRPLYLRGPDAKLPVGYAVTLA